MAQATLSDAPQDAGRAFLLVNGAALVEENMVVPTKTIEICSSIHCMAVGRLLWSKIVSGSEHPFIEFVSQIFFTVKILRESQIEYSQNAIFWNKQIARLDISMNKASLMGIFKTLSRLTNVIHGLTTAQRTIDVESSEEIAPAA
ncbi:MAG: hypothetical protein U0936_00040 [Planctomycetaceae bacterium]